VVRSRDEGTGFERKRPKPYLYQPNLAWLHTRHYADFVNHAGPQAIQMLREAGIRKGVVCDAGCGGGQLSERLIGAGYGVIAVDASAAMIELARKRAPRATLICGSIADINLPACQAVIAIGEVFNYLGSRSTMARAFRNLFHSLTPGGILIFDVKEPPAKKIERTSCRYGEDWALIAQIQEDPVRQRLVRIIHTFIKSGSFYSRQKEVHTLSIYPMTEIKRLLRSAGFRVRGISGYGSYKLGPERKVLVARKPDP
jgi:SAM-dependent methyltransferase